MHILDIILYVYDKYADNFEEITDHKMYTKNYNQQDLRAVFKYLDEMYENYLKNPQQKQAKKESHNTINEKIDSSNLNTSNKLIQIVLITFVLAIFAIMIYGIVLAFTLI